MLLDLTILKLRSKIRLIKGDSVDLSLLYDVKPTFRSSEEKKPKVGQVSDPSHLAIAKVASTGSGRK
jgi:hypothetical protein